MEERQTNVNDVIKTLGGGLEVAVEGSTAASQRFQCTDLSKTENTDKKKQNG